jgi:hypothetical protein
MQTPKKKLIEVALPLDVINYHAAREKSIRHGHPSTLHLWWARRPLAACRAVLFASLVDDPRLTPTVPTEEAQKRERDRLFDEILADLVRWENSNKEQVLEKARKEILASTAGTLRPAGPLLRRRIHPLEAQRLGLQVYASDLNPVAVLITKALVEITTQVWPGIASESGSALTHRRGSELARRRGIGRRRAVLRPLDAREGVGTDRASLPDGQTAQGAGRWRSDRDRVAVGANGPLS